MKPLYLNLSLDELEEKIQLLFSLLERCSLCPRKCGVNRLKRERGFCQLGYWPTVSSFGPHFGEEKVLVGKGGSGTIFFTSCNLSCVYCQNYDISQLKKGEEISFVKLAETMIFLQNQGCVNINLVTPTPQVPQIIKALKIAITKGLKVPLVYNTSSYDSLEVLRVLKGIIDIYLPDAKYGDNKVGEKYSGVKNYFDIMKKAIKEMYSQVGNLKIDKRGVAFRGVLVRHLVLPQNIARSEKIFRFISKQISPLMVVNIMAQYYPCYQAFHYPELSRPITEKECQEVIKKAKENGLLEIYNEIYNDV